MNTLKRICLMCPENISSETERRLLSALISHNGLGHYAIDVRKFPATPSALYDNKLTETFVEQVERTYGTFAFVPFPDNSIHSAHGRIIFDEWRKHVGHFYEVRLDGKVSLVEDPLMLHDRVLSRLVTHDHVWGRDRYMHTLH
jgi:hypothetical protein